MTREQRRWWDACMGLFGWLFPGKGELHGPLGRLRLWVFARVVEAHRWAWLRGWEFERR